MIAQNQEWAELLSQRHCIRLLSFDIAKGFDRAWYMGLLQYKPLGRTESLDSRLFEMLADLIRQRSLHVVLDGFISK